MQGYLWCLHFEEKIEGLWTGKVKSDFCIEFLRVLKYYSIFQWNLNFLKPWIFLKLYLLPKHSCHSRLGAGDFTQRNPATVIGGADLGFLLGWGAPLRNGITDWWHNSNWHVQFSRETEGSMRVEAKQNPQDTHEQDMWRWCTQNICSDQQKGFCAKLPIYGIMFYFNTNKPHSFFFFGRIPVILESHMSSQGARGAHPLPPPPRSASS